MVLTNMVLKRSALVFDLIDGVKNILSPLVQERRDEEAIKLWILSLRNDEKCKMRLEIESRYTVGTNNLTYPRFNYTPW